MRCERRERMVLTKENLNHASSSHLFPKITLYTVLTCSQRSHCTQFSPVPKDHAADDVGRELGQQRLQGYRVTLTLVYDLRDCTCLVLHTLLQRLLAHPEVSQGHESHSPKLFPFWSVTEYHPWPFQKKTSVKKNSPSMHTHTHTHSNNIKKQQLTNKRNRKRSAAFLETFIVITFILYQKNENNNHQIDKAEF